MSETIFCLENNLDDLMAKAEGGNLFVRDMLSEEDVELMQIYEEVMHIYNNVFLKERYIGLEDVKTALHDAMGDIEDMDTPAKGVILSQLLRTYQELHTDYKNY